MNIQIIPTKAFYDQKAGTSGLRKRVRDFRCPHYLENFIQSLFDCIESDGKTLVIGGDGRFFNLQAIEVIISMAAAAGVKKLYIGQNGYFSTPAISHFIRSYQLDGGIILSASHNPGGETGDFGIKYNGADGGAASENLTEKIFQYSQTLKFYKKIATSPFDLSQPGHYQLAEMEIEIVDPIKDYADYMEQIFDFSVIKTLAEQGFRLYFDAMSAITGPYAVEIFEKRLGFAECVHNKIPLQDFGGKHPDPNPKYARDFYELFMQSQKFDFGAASDGDGDRNMVMACQTYMEPADALAILLDHADYLPFYQGQVKGVARSMPTSRAVDRVVQAKNIPLYITPTGWKFFVNLLNHEKITFCGEESFATSSHHIREKDGIWAVLFWLNILAVRQMSLQDILHHHWQKFGRDYTLRYDYENVSLTAVQKLFAYLRVQCLVLKGQKFKNLVVESAHDFCYQDPIDQSQSHHQGIEIVFTTGERAVLRQSGTGTQGATLRIYMEKYEQDPTKLHQDKHQVLKELHDCLMSLTKMNAFLSDLLPSATV